jgi:uncharacterized protein (DUF1330 family)
MKIHYAVALSMLAGAALAAATVQALHAQSKSFIYLITETDLTDIKKMTEYDVTFGPKMTASIRTFGGRVVVSRLIQPEPVEGEAPKSRIGIIAWDSLEKMQAWRNSPEYKDARKIGDMYAKYRSYTLVGVPQ